MGVNRDGAKDFAYYSDAWIWPDSRASLMKTLLLFFDGIALSLPQDLANTVIDRNQALAQPLLERGLLVNLEPDEYLRPETAKNLAQSLHAVIERFPAEERSVPYFLDVGAFHYGGLLAQFEADALTEAMLRRGIAVPIGRTREPDSYSQSDTGIYDVDPAIRLLILSSYCQALSNDLKRGSEISLQPVAELTSAEHSVHAWAHMRQALIDLQGTSTPSSDSSDYIAALPLDHERRRNAEQDAVHILTSDLEAVSIDLSEIPLDEVLGFRASHQEELITYTSGLRDLLRITGDLSVEQFSAEITERKARLIEEAKDLRSIMVKAFGRTTLGVVLSIAGATWMATQGDLVGALLSASGAGAALTLPRHPVTTYSYVLAAGREFRLQ